MWIARTFSMPNHETFTVPPIKELLDLEIEDDGKNWLDPFARNSQRAEKRNDINPATKAEYHLDAVDFLKMFPDGSADGCLYDPPYSPRQVKECYDGIGIKYTYEESTNQKVKEAKNEIARVVKPGGKVISFGWNSNGMGAKRGFVKVRILLVSHGGLHNDTICVVEQKVVENTFEGLLA